MTDGPKRRPLDLEPPDCDPDDVPTYLRLLREQQGAPARPVDRDWTPSSVLGDTEESR